MVPNTCQENILALLQHGGRDRALRSSELGRVDGRPASSAAPRRSRSAQRLLRELARRFNGLQRRPRRPLRRIGWVPISLVATC